MRFEICVYFKGFRRAFSLTDFDVYFGVARPDAVGVGRAARIFDDGNEFNF